MKTRTKTQTIVSGVSKITIQKRFFFIWFNFGHYHKDAQGNIFLDQNFNNGNFSIKPD